MFYVWNVAGLSSPYSPGVIRNLRKTPPVEHVDAIQQVSSGKDEGAHRVAESYERHLPAFERKKALSAGDIMSSPVVSVEQTTVMAVVSDIMATKRFRHVPVINPQKKIVGILSDRDVLRFNIKAAVNKLDVQNVLASTIMVSHVLTARPEAEIKEVVRVMFEERIGAMPIVNNSGEIIGIITRSDILRAVLTQGKLELWV